MFKIFAVREECDPPVYVLGVKETLDFDPDTEWEAEGSFPEGYEIMALNEETGNMLWLEDDWTLADEIDRALLADAPVWVPPVDPTYRPVPATLDYSGERFRFLGDLENGLDYTSLEDAVQMTRIWAEVDGEREWTVVSSSGGRWRVRDGEATAL